MVGRAEIALVLEAELVFLRMVVDDMWAVRWGCQRRQQQNNKPTTSPLEETMQGKARFDAGLPEKRFYAHVHCS